MIFLLVYGEYFSVQFVSFVSYNFLRNFDNGNQSLTRNPNFLWLVKGYLTDVNKYLRERDDSSASEDDRDRESVTFLVGGGYEEYPNVTTMSASAIQTSSTPQNAVVPMTTSVSTINALRASLSYPPQLVHQGNSVER